MGLDTSAFNTCLDTGKYAQVVQDQTNIARQLGVSNTPTFALNGQAVVGAVTFDEFKTKIDALLNPSTPTP